MVRDKRAKVEYEGLKKQMREEIEAEEGVDNISQQLQNTGINTT